MKYFITLLASLSFCACSHSIKKAEGDQAQTVVAPAPEVKAPAAKSETQKVACSNEADKRLLEVSEKGSGCELAYTKNGKASMVATSSQGTQHCEASLKKIRANLEKAGFDCK